ncbi:GNAT family N-acetyltransferase [Micromonospora sp. NPDC005173]|uniref:GNAT family N-acetyltransferase n=1 Tax=Micromonospora sp. NPDC005173 TaxID=3157165 RepID=UPI0033BC74A0
MAGNAEDMITLTSAEQDSGGSNLSGATAPDADDLVITNNSALGIYEAAIGGGQPLGSSTARSGAASYCWRQPCSPSFGEKGVAARLIGGVLDELRTQGKTATVTCPFAAAFVDAHPKYADVLDPAFPRSHTAGHGH